MAKQGYAQGSKGATADAYKKRIAKKMQDPHEQKMMRKLKGQYKEFLKQKRGE